MRLFKWGEGEQVHILLKELLELNGILMALGIGGIVGILGVLVRATEKVKFFLGMLKHSILALLHAEIYKEFHRLIDQGWVTIDDLNNLEHLWDGYHGMGGNGTGENLYKRVLELPIREKEKGEN